MCAHYWSTSTVLTLCNQVVFCIILTQREPEVTGVEKCDSGTCKFALVSRPVEGSIPATDCLQLTGFYLTLICKIFINVFFCKETFCMLTPLLPLRSPAQGHTLLHVMCKRGTAIL